ncbi:MAG TPA: CPBP family intramembrane glutamic endopeptidase [Patescibacteria group bacterium]|nr:CPBP family intramembrane glutamic endopeptidase [Patescibacteria group bacterium]
MSAAGSRPTGGVEGWSGAPLASRLPAIALVAAVGLGAVVRPAAPFVFVGLLVLYLFLRRTGQPPAILAAVLPAAAILVWRSLPQPVADSTGADCANLLAPPAVWRFLEGAIGLVAVVALVIDRRASLGELGLRRGSRTVQVLAVVSLLVITPIALAFSSLVGGTFGGVFFGSFRLDTSQPAAYLPALVFAVSNSLAEELAYRGAMRTWLVPGLGVVGANLAQAIVFGLSHTGDDFVGVEAAVPTMLAMIVVGLVGGVVARRTRSLTLPIAVHAAADIPLYFYWACRLA